MPYKQAYIWVLLLFPAVAVAFWPSYFGRLGTAPWLLHAHGVTASLWTALTALQSWSIHHGARPTHRFAGRASMVLFPAFWVSGLLIVQFMATGFVLKDNPFHALYGARLAPVDMLGSAAILYLYYLALSRRRSTFTHAAAMLTIPLFLLPPIFVRLLQIGGPFAITGPDEFYKFGYGLETCNMVSVAIALWAWSRRPRDAWPFLVGAATIVAQSLAFETFGKSGWWEGGMSSVAAIPIPAIAGVGLLVSGIAIWLGWTRPQGQRRTVGQDRQFAGSAP